MESGCWSAEKHGVWVQIIYRREGGAERHRRNLYRGRESCFCYGKLLREALSRKLRIFISGGYGNQGFGPSLHDNEEGGGLDGRSTIELTASGRRLRGFLPSIARDELYIRGGSFVALCDYNTGQAYALSF